MIPARMWSCCLTLTLVAFRCHPTHAREAAAPVGPVSAPMAVVEPIWSSGLKGDWHDDGWAPHDPAARGPAQMSFSGYGGWILAHPELAARYGGLRLRLKAPAGWPDFLEVRLDSTRPQVFPRVRPAARHRLSTTRDGWVELFIPIEELDPQRWPFDRVVLRAFREVPDVPLSFDDVGLTAEDPRRPRANGGLAGAAAPERPGEVRIDCRAPTHPISPLIYGIAYSPRQDAHDRQQWTLGATARRWGGNPASRYNWELGNAWNTGADYFFRNLDYTGEPGYTWDNFLQADLAAGMKTALTVPLLGWVAKDTRSVGFPASRFGPQAQMDPDLSEAGNGVARNGKKLVPGPPSLTSVPAGPDFVERWVRAIRQKDQKRGRSVQLYILDNEPMLWNDTHRDVHPEPTSYDELLGKTLAFAHAVRKADPEAVIAGPALWGWPAYFGSAVDQAAGWRAPDRRAHGNVPFLAWYLRKLHEHEQRTGERLLDVVDVHFYPQAKGLGEHEAGRTDAAAAALRIRSTRALWDPTYRDESWIDDTIQLIPRLKAWIAENYPGRGISIGEYNFGGEGHISGGLAVAEALGRFGEQGITSAFYWTYPPLDSPAAWAFRLYRNYDGKGAHFGDVSVRAQAAPGLSAFVSRAEEGKLVAVLLNLDPSAAVAPALKLSGCGALQPHRAFTYDGDPKGLLPRPLGKDGARLPSLPPYSMTVIELGAPPAAGGAPAP